MAEQTTSSIIVEAAPSAVMAVIADFGSYPSWAKGVKVADVEATGPDGRPARVHFVLDVAPIKDDYTLEYAWDGDRQVTWTLARGNMLRALDGAYVLRDLSDGGVGRTEVTYRLALDLTIPLIGMLKRRGEKILIETALRGLKTRVETTPASS
jgi:ribosome-associated toxin RatA of RatAB toxin-antitoxin module